MAADEKWYFTKEQLTNTPSRRCGIDSDKELSYRQQAANFIQDLGQRLVVSQLCINTAIVYMHRFYVFHSLSQFHRNAIAAAALFLAAKVEEQPRKLEHVIKMAHMCLHQPPPDVRSEQYLEQAQDLVFNENVLLQTLGFDVAIDHPHTHVVRCCQLVKASKDLAQTSYFMASNSLHLTTMCLQYKPTVVACFCIHLACKWSNWEIPQSNEGKHWFWYVDRTVTSELLQQLTAEFLHIFDKCPSRLKRKIMSISATQSPSISHPSLPNSPFDAEPRKVQSPATTAEGGPIFHSSRSHHGEKQEDKKGLAPPSSRPPVDYREYREKKERERFEREKAAAGAATSSSSSTLLSVSSSASSASAASTTVASSHLPEINKHHSHHHKPVSSSNVVNKHPISAGQKSTLHHNHHHRPDLKVGQPVPQRHSSSSQVRESSRDSNRQRLQREYNSSGGTNSASLQYHGHSTHQMKDANLDSSSTETDIHRSDVSTSQDLSGSMSLQDKLSNNNHNVHRSSSVDKHQSHDKGLYDPRHKPMDHKKDGDQKPYNKYLDPSRTERQRKPDSLEQRSEEVRKLIEKPLTLPKSSLEASYAANAQKQFHHSKYNQTDKIQSNSGITSSDSKLSVSQNAFTQEKSPSSVSTSSIYPPKMQQSKIVPGQLSAHGVSQILKDTIKNGGTSLASLNNIDDPKAEKRPRYDDTNKSTSDLQQPILQTPPGKHKSLFSPEKVPSSRDTHVQKSKTKQKTPPSAAKVPKERIPEVSIGNLPLSFTSPPGMQQPESIGSIKRSATDSCTTSHKRHRTSNNDESVQQVKPKVEDNSSFEAVKMLGRVPELIQPIRDNPANGKTTSNLSDIKPTELNKLFEPESMLRFSSTSVNQLGIANGIDTIFVKQEPKDFHVSTDPFKTEMSLKLENPPLKTEYSSPMKSAQSISALLQEPLTSMPSLLQNMQPYGQMTTQQTHQEQVQQPQQPQPLQQQPQPQPQPQPQQQQQQQQQSGHHNNHHYLHHHPHSHLQQQQPLQTILSTDQVTMQTHCMPIPSANEVAVASTVDISVLSVPVQSSTESIVSVPIPNTPAVVPLEEKRSEHHKSEKKKKEKKHKHKDKDRSKEKHKRKHKDKDKEKHREKDKDKEKGEEPVAAVPIKITIPKDKLNLSTETTAGGSSVSASTSEKTKSPPNTSIKIIIPKERLKGADNVSNSPGQSVSVQAPLKIKIRTDGISRISGGSNTVGGNVSAGLPEFPVESRKRERERERERDRDRDRDRERERIDNKESPTVGVPPTKKQPQMTSLGYGQHRPSERQNGRHYGSSSNNKEKYTSSHHKSSSKLPQSQQSHAT